MNKQEALRNIKAHFKARIDCTKIHFSDIKQMISEDPSSYDALKQSLKLARSSLRLEILLHNINLKEAVKEFDKYKGISNYILDLMMFGDDKWGVGIVDISAQEKTKWDYIGVEDNESEDLRRMSENMMGNIKMYEEDIIQITSFTNIYYDK